MKAAQLPFLAKLALVLFSTIALGYLAIIGQSILSPIFFAFLLALLFLPFANFLERRLKFSRTLSTFSALFIMLIILAGLVYFFANQFSSFVDDFPTLQKQISKSFHDLQVWFSKTFNVRISKQMNYINQGLDQILASTGSILGFTVSMFASMGGFFAFSVLFFIFILNYRRILYQFITSVFNQEHFKKVNQVIFEIQKIIKDYIVGLFIQILIVSVFTSILLSVLNVKYAILLGVLTGILNVIPYIGIFTSAFFACLISFATGGSKTLFVLLGYVLIHIIDANITLPLVVGSKVKINPLFSFLGLLVGEELWGISGMFFSIPFLAMIKIILEHIDDLKPWGKVMGEESKMNKIRRKYKITKKITLEEKE